MSKNQTAQEQSRQPKKIIFFDEIFCFDNENMRKNVKVRVDDNKKGEENGFFYENSESKFSNQSPISPSESFTKIETPLIKGEIKMNKEDTQKKRGEI